MKIERVTENRIKVMIDGQEAEKFNLSFQNISQYTPEAQRLLRIVIKMAKENIDFSVDGAKLFVEAVRDEDWDGFGMMITRVSSDEDLKEAISNCSYRGTLKRTRLKLGKDIEEEKQIFCFSDFENACMAAEELMTHFSGFSSLYKYQSRFYLCLIPDGKETVKRTETILLEFGEKVENSRYMQGRLNEYGELMIPQRAIEVMKEYFPVYELNH
ncbi:MAG: adaptor protein MecA [Clostridia bacterium]|nr:adaptor protein MecA [Clostridia bacterium]